jgi:hypothetical protein
VASIATGPAVEVIDHFLQAGLPVSSLVMLTAETDPGRLLGRPGQYVGKAVWHDPRTDTPPSTEVSSGGAVEVFATEADLRRRRDQLTTATPAGSAAEHLYTRGLALVRVSGKLAPAQAAEYQRALESWRPQ